jgi:hypothetical protein
MKTIALLPCVAIFIACSSSDQDPGLEGAGVSAADSAPDTNPDGKAYPTDNIGVVARKGATSGNRIANYKFLGYPDADESKGLQPISLAQFYDPTGARYRIIHIQAAGVWCAACKSETEVVVPNKKLLDDTKTVWLVSMAEGATQSVPSKQSDLNNWISTYKSPFTHWLDPGNQKLGPFYDRSALPWNANIDAKTMEILTSATGAVTSATDLASEIDAVIALADATKLTIAQ